MVGPNCWMELKYSKVSRVNLYFKEILGDLKKSNTIRFQNVFIMTENFLEESCKYYWRLKEENSNMHSYFFYTLPESLWKKPTYTYYHKWRGNLVPYGIESKVNYFFFLFARVLRNIIKLKLRYEYCILPFFIFFFSDLECNMIVQM